MKRRFVLFIVSCILMFSLTACNAEDYKNAMAQYDSGAYEEALKAFEALGDYENSSEMVKECKYQIAVSFLKSLRYEDATELFKSLGNYLDSAELASESQYRLAMQQFRMKRYEECVQLLSEIKEYKDAYAYVKGYELLQNLVGEYSCDVDEDWSYYSTYDIWLEEYSFKITNELTKVEQTDSGDCVIYFKVYENKCEVRSNGVGANLVLPSPIEACVSFDADTTKSEVIVFYMTEHSNIWSKITGFIYNVKPTSGSKYTLTFAPVGNNGSIIVGETQTFDCNKK